MNGKKARRLRREAEEQTRGEPLKVTKALYRRLKKTTRRHG